MSKRLGASWWRDVWGVELAVGEICRIEQTVTQAGAPAVEDNGADFAVVGRFRPTYNRSTPMIKDMHFIGDGQAGSEQIPNRHDNLRSTQVLAYFFLFVDE